MMGLVSEGVETIEEGREKDPRSADLALIAAAQRVEHYEISAYGTAKCLARQVGEIECAKLLSHTLGEEESTDFLLTAIAEPLLQQLRLSAQGEKTARRRRRPRERKQHRAKSNSVSAWSCEPFSTSCRSSSIAQCPLDNLGLVKDVLLP
jgi:hypothetical protein